MRRVTMLISLFAMGTLVFFGCGTSSTPLPSEHSVQKPVLDDTDADDLTTEETIAEETVTEETTSDEPVADDAVEPAADDFEPEDAGSDELDVEETEQ